MTPTPELEAVMSSFAASRGTCISEPAHVRGLCVEVSQDFVDHCLAAGIPAQLIHGAVYGELPEYPGVTLLMSGHSAALVANGADDLVVDWTAHQFDPAAPVPHVASLDLWRSTWEQIGARG